MRSIGDFRVTGSTELGHSQQDTHKIIGSITASGDFAPSTGSTYDLGSPENPWRDLYISSASVFIGGTKLSTTEAGDIKILDINDTPKTIVVETVKLAATSGDEVTLQIDADTGRLRTLNSSGVPYGTTGSYSDSDVLAILDEKQVFTSSEQLKARGFVIEDDVMLGIFADYHTGSFDVSGSILAQTT